MCEVEEPLPAPVEDSVRFWSFTVQVLQQQCPALQMPMAINGFDGPEDLVSQVEVALDAAPGIVAFYRLILNLPPISLS